MGSSKTHFPSKLLRLGKATKLPRKSKKKTQKISNKDKSNTTFPVKRQSIYRNIQEIFLGEKSYRKLQSISFFNLSLSLQNCTVFSPVCKHHSSLSAITLTSSVFLLITLFFSLVMPVFWLQLPRVFVGPLHIVDAYFSQNFFQVYLKGNKNPN